MFSCIFPWNHFTRFRSADSSANLSFMLLRNVRLFRNFNAKLVHEFQHKT